MCGWGRLQRTSLHYLRIASPHTLHTPGYSPNGAPWNPGPAHPIQKNSPSCAQPPFEACVARTSTTRLLDFPCCQVYDDTYPTPGIRQTMAELWWFARHALGPDTFRQTLVSAQSPCFLPTAGGRRSLANHGKRLFRHPLGKTHFRQSLVGTLVIRSPLNENRNTLGKTWWKTKT